MSLPSLKKFWHRMNPFLTLRPCKGFFCELHLVINPNETKTKMPNFQYNETLDAWRVHKNRKQIWKAKIPINRCRWASPVIEVECIFVGKKSTKIKNWQSRRKCWCLQRRKTKLCRRWTLLVLTSLHFDRCLWTSSLLRWYIQSEWRSFRNGFEEQGWIFDWWQKIAENARMTRRGRVAKS